MPFKIYNFNALSPLKRPFLFFLFKGQMQFVTLLKSYTNLCQPLVFSFGQGLYKILTTTYRRRETGKGKRERGKGKGERGNGKGERGKGKGETGNYGSQKKTATKRTAQKRYVLCLLKSKICLHKKHAVKILTNRLIYF